MTARGAHERYTMNRSRLACITLLACAAAAPLTNDRYTLDVQPDFSVKVTVSGAPSRALSPTFVVMRSDKDPGLAANHRNYYLTPRTSARWANYEMPLAELNKWLASPDTLASIAPNKASVTEDASGLRTWIYVNESGKPVYKLADKVYSGGTTDVFLVGTPIRPKATGATVTGRVIRWTFADAKPIKLTAEVELPEGAADPIVRWKASVASDGFYSVVYAGAPDEAADDVQAIPQEVFGRQFHQYNHVVHEGDLKLPRAQLATDKFSSTLVIDPSESRWGLPNRYNQRFGLMVDRKDGRMRPMAVAPLIGGPESKVKAGATLAFATRYVLMPGEWRETLWHVARNIYGFKDQRDNSGTGSLNGTLERVIDYLADRNGKNWAMWNAEEKYYDYFADKSGVFKPFSPIFGLTAAVVTDDVDFYKRRALPAVEFALSRKSNIFSPFELKDNGMISAPTRALGAPYPSAEQLVTIHDLFGRGTPIFATYAEEKGFEQGYVERLAKWRLTGDAKDLAEAVKVADQQAKNPKGSYMDWLEVYEASPKPEYLKAAVAAAYVMAQQMNLSPPVPDKNVVMEKGGKVPVHAHSWGRHKVWGFAPPVEFPFKEQTVPAWRPALTGIISDAYRAGFWMNDQGQFIRIAGYAKDDYLRDMARWGMVGRFGNHNGDNRSFLSLIPESTDALENPIWKLSFTTVNPGHAWEFAGEVIDFLVSDAQHRSAGAIKFPGGSMSGSAFRCTSFGGRPGTFYGVRDVTLWLPRKLLAIDNPQIDYLAGVAPDGTLCLAMWSQSFKEEKVTVKIDPTLVPLAGAKSAKAWRENKPAGEESIKDGTFTFTIPAKGIVAYAIADSGAKPKLLAAKQDKAAPKLGIASVSRVKASFGNVNGMLISMGAGLTNAFVYTDAPPEAAINATLRYRQGTGEWQTKHDEIFPWEFSVEVDPAKGAFEYEFAVETLDLETKKAEPATLKME